MMTAVAARWRLLTVPGATDGLQRIGGDKQEGAAGRQGWGQSAWLARDKERCPRAADGGAWGGLGCGKADAGGVAGGGGAQAPGAAASRGAARWPLEAGLRFEAPTALP